MRFMVMVKASKDSEAGKMPGQDLLTAMGKFNEELVKAGIMQAGEGLQPSSKGARVKFVGDKRIDTLPEVPTVAEAGYPDLKAGSWQGIFVPSGTPREAVERLFEVSTKVMKEPDVIARLKNGGAEAVTSSSPEEFQKFVAAETERWAKIAKEAGATPD